jgi:hypothetical protein
MNSKGKMELLDNTIIWVIKRAGLRIHCMDIVGKSSTLFFSNV